MTEADTTVKLSQPRVRVTVEREDGQLVQVDIQTDNRDAVRYDLSAARQGWPAQDRAPMLWMTYLAWSALRRDQSELAPKDPQAWFDSCVEIVPIDDDGNVIRDASELTAARPTQPDHESGY